MICKRVSLNMTQFSSAFYCLDKYGVENLMGRKDLVEFQIGKSANSNHILRISRVHHEKLTEIGCTTSTTKISKTKMGTDAAA